MNHDRDDRDGRDDLSAPGDPGDPGDLSDPGDDALEDELRQAAALLDPVPAHALDAALQAYTFRTVDTELAALTFDSLAEEELVRGTDRPRLLTFQATGRTIEVEVAGAGADLRLIGRITPPEAAPVVIRSREQEITVTADALGRFRCTLGGCGIGVTGPVSLRFGDVVTEWFAT
jgi:hypothetical protein